jgi:hypothetical protein
MILYVHSFPACSPPGPWHAACDHQDGNGSITPSEMAKALKDTKHLSCFDAFRVRVFVLCSLISLLLRQNCSLGVLSWRVILSCDSWMSNIIRTYPALTVTHSLSPKNTFLIPFQLSLPKLTHWFQILDLNGDGVLTFEEFITRLYPLATKRERVQMNQWAFPVIGFINGFWVWYPG